MNDRFVKLAYQAKLFDGTGTVPFEDVAKFAELIVAECAEALRLVPYNSDRDFGDEAIYQEAIYKHFGVEERAIPILSDDEEALLSGITSSKLFTIEAVKKAFGVEE
jgi:hypothetical protein